MAATPTCSWSMPRPIRRPAPRGMTAFLIEKGFKGFTHGQHLDKLGMRGSNTYPLFFDECEVPEENVLGKVGEGVKVLMSGLDYERAVLSRRAARHHGRVHGCGGALHARAQAVRPADRRFPADAGQARRHVFDVAGHARLCLRGGQGLRSRRDHAQGRGRLRSSTPPRRRRGWPARRSRRSAAMATSTTIPVGRLWRDAKLYEIGAGTSEIRRMLIGRELMAETA